MGLAGRMRRMVRRCLFEYRMGIRAADSERTDSGASWGFGARPFGERGVPDEGAVREVDLRVRIREMQAGGNDASVECEGGFDQASDACTGIEVADVCFDR